MEGLLVIYPSIKQCRFFLQSPFQIDRCGINFPPHDGQNQAEAIDHFHCGRRFFILLRGRLVADEQQPLGQIGGLL